MDLGHSENQQKMAPYQAEYASNVKWGSSV